MSITWLNQDQILYLYYHQQFPSIWGSPEATRFCTVPCCGVNCYLRVNADLAIDPREIDHLYGFKVEFSSTIQHGSAAVLCIGGVIAVYTRVALRYTYSKCYHNMVALVKSTSSTTIWHFHIISLIPNQCIDEPTAHSYPSWYLREGEGRSDRRSAEWVQSTLVEP